MSSAGYQGPGIFAMGDFSVFGYRPPSKLSVANQSRGGKTSTNGGAFEAEGKRGGFPACFLDRLSDTQGAPDTQFWEQVSARLMRTADVLAKPFIIAMD